LTRRRWICGCRLVCPQIAQVRCRRSRTVTMIASTLMLTSMTDAPRRRSSRFNAVVMRTSSSW
jgi:hypothetical protein